MKNKLILFFLLVNTTSLFAQLDSTVCIREVLAYEDALYGDLDLEKTVYVNYKTTALDWDDNLASSEVKIYKNATNVHFFSKEGNLYRDNDEMFLVLPIQKLIVADQLTEEIKANSANKDFIETRKKFLLNCQYVFCKVTDSTKGIKQLKLRVHEDLEGIIEIEEMLYTYNTKTKRILKSTVWYSGNYKIKKMTINYLDFKKESDYKFKKASRYVLANSNKLLAKYSAFELIDNRNNK